MTHTVIFIYLFIGGGPKMRQSDSPQPCSECSDSPVKKKLADDCEFVGRTSSTSFAKVQRAKHDIKQQGDDIFAMINNLPQCSHIFGQLVRRQYIK